MPVIVTIVNIVVKPEYLQQFIEATVENHRHSIREEGNLRFDVLQHRDNASAFTLYEAYESEEAAARHKQTDRYLKWRDTVESWMDGPRKGIVHDVVAPTDITSWTR